MAEIEKNVNSKHSSDRIMWFSMWFFLTIVTFGAVGPIMIYYLIKRRNDHFERTEKLFKLLQNHLEKAPVEDDIDSFTLLSTPSKTKDTVTPKNALNWALLSFLIFPMIYVLYFLTQDLQKHKKSEHSFFTKTFLLVSAFKLDLPLDKPEIDEPWTKYLQLTELTLGFASIYWLYKIFNDYNYHFKMQWKTEEDLLKFLRENSS